MMKEYRKCMVASSGRMKKPERLRSPALDRSGSGVHIDLAINGKDGRASETLRTPAQAVHFPVGVPVAIRRHLSAFPYNARTAKETTRFLFTITSVPHDHGRAFAAKSARPKPAGSTQGGER